MIETKGSYFHIATARSSYVMRVTDTGILENVAYTGRLLSTEGLELVPESEELIISACVYTDDEHPGSISHRERPEYPTAGIGDPREPALDIDYGNGLSVLRLRYEGYEIIKGKDNSFPAHALPGPSTETLLIRLRDVALPIEVLLRYTVYEEEDVILRSARVVNRLERAVLLRAAASLSLDLPYDDFSLITFDGAHLREKTEHEERLREGMTVIDSRQGLSSNEHNPLIFLRRSNGEVYGFNLIYSGSHREAVTLSTFGKTRVQTGINPATFSWTLSPGGSFETPEAVMTFSQDMTDASLNFHRFVSRYIVRGAWKDRERPVLINNWEATYFDFDEQKLLRIADTAASLGFELLVLDDGWFGSRRDDTQGLGDWWVSEDIFPDGLGSFADKVRERGLEFGFWIEPECINKKSELYKAHPDWVLEVPGRTPAVCRNQYVLDLSREEVVDYLFTSISKVMRDARPSYIKWDMNRPLTDVYSHAHENQGEVMHRYTLGLYDLMGRFNEAFPEVLFEGCASGGNRFDLGMLCFQPQFWTSDNTDSFHRVAIQSGSLRGYPASTMTCHVSAAPAHQSLRTTSIESRFDVSCFGVLGYELDISKLDEEDKASVKAQIEFYKKYRRIIQFGDVRLLESSDSNLVWWSVTKDGTTLVLEFQSRNRANTGRCDVLRVPFLRKDRRYRVRNRVEHLRADMLGVYASKAGSETERLDVTVSGSILSACGISLPPQFMGTGVKDGFRVLGDNGARIYIIEEL